MKLRLVCDWFVYLVVRMFICVVQAMRIETCHAMARGLSVLAYDVLRLRGTVVDENLRHAFPQWTARQRRSVIRRMWEHLALMICEVAHVPRKVHDTNWRKYVSLKNISPMVAGLLSPRPTVVLTGHFGNFEVCGYIAGLLGFPTHTIARPLDNQFIDRFLSRFRGATGQFMLPKHGVAGQIAELLDGGGTLALLGDQYAGSKGCWVEFFGRPASCHKAIAIFSLSSGAPMFVSYTRRLRRPMQFELGVNGHFDPNQPGQAAADVKDLSQWYSRLLEDLIRVNPEQYWWVHRRWKDKRKRRRKRPDSRQKPPQADGNRQAESPVDRDAA